MHPIRKTGTHPESKTTQGFRRLGGEAGGISLGMYKTTGRYEGRRDETADAHDQGKKSKGEADRTQERRKRGKRECGGRTGRETGPTSNIFSDGDGSKLCVS